LAHLEKDAAWRARYFAGDAAARQEFHSLTAKLSADPVGLAAQASRRHRRLTRITAPLPAAGIWFRRLIIFATWVR
jgi:hypothetical protein